VRGLAILAVCNLSIGCFDAKIHDLPCNEELAEQGWEGDIATLPTSEAVVGAGPVSFGYVDPANDPGGYFSHFDGYLVISKDGQPLDWIPWEYSSQLEVLLEEGRYVWWMDGYFDVSRARVVDCPFPHNRLTVR
jgi:hypothetical protein